jgi:hypothetical protein
MENVFKVIVVLTMLVFPLLCLQPTHMGGEDKGVIVVIVVVVVVNDVFERTEEAWLASAGDI